jgi:GAF domain-containing protein
MDLISKQFGFYHAGIFLLDERDEYAVLQAASSEGGRRMLERGHKLRVGEVGIVGHVASTGEPRVALDVGEDTAHFAHPDLPNTRSEMALPLKVQDRVIGVLDVQSTHEAAFSEDDVAVLQTMADQLATAIANARLFEQVQRRARREQLIREITARIRSAVDVESILQTTVQELGKALGTSHGLVRLGTEMELRTPLVKEAGDAEGK